MLEDLAKPIQDLKEEISRNRGGVFDAPAIEAQIREREALSAAPDFWSDPEKARRCSQEIKY